MSLTKKDYIQLLQGKSQGQRLKGGCYLVTDRVKNSQTSLGAALLTEKVGLPAQLNPTYPTEPSKKRKIDQSLLKYF